MAILIRGKSRCPICNEVIREGQEALCYPPFVPNRLDELYVFNDAPVHSECAQKHPGFQSAEEVVAEAARGARPENRVCEVCHKPIQHPDDHYTLGYLSNEDPLQRWNFKQFHRACLKDWPDRSEFASAFNEAIKAGTMMVPEVTMRYLDPVLR